MEHKYPLKMQGVDSDLVVEFSSLNVGIVINSGTSSNRVVEIRYDFWEHTDTSAWKPYIEPTEEKPFQLEVGKTYVTRDGKGKGTVLCVDLKDEKQSCAIRFTHTDYKEETTYKFSIDGRFSKAGKNPYDLVALYNPLKDVKKWTPIWVRDKEPQDDWQIRMFLGVSSDGRVQATTGYGNGGATWNFYTLTQPTITE